MLLELDGIKTYYGNIRALKGISLKVDEGEIVCLIGANGAGKSTSLMTISGVLVPLDGVRARRDIDTPEDWREWTGSTLPPA